MSGNSGLVVNAGAGNVTFTGAVGGTKVPANVTISGAAVNLAAIAVKDVGELNITNTSTSAITGAISGFISFTKDGSGTLTLSGTNTSYTGVTQISGGTLKISSDTNLGAVQGSSGTNIIFNGGILNTTADITLSATRGISLTGAGTINTDSGTTLTYGGVISGAGAFTKSGNGDLALSGTNTYTGSTTISAGTLYITNAAGLGNSSTGTTVSDGATLRISGAITVAEPITINGTGVSTVGAIYFLSGNNTYSGAITLGSNSTLTSAAGNQVISGTINGAYTLGVTAAGNWTQSGIIGASTAPTSYTISAGSNTVTLSADHTISGPITITGANIYIRGNLTTTASGDINLTASTLFSNDSGVRRTISTSSGNIYAVADSDGTGLLTLNIVFAYKYF